MGPGSHVGFPISTNVFGADLKSNMAAMVHNVFSLAEILKIFLSETTKSIQ
jgi:hypothetical protein